MRTEAVEVRREGRRKRLRRTVPRGAVRFVAALAVVAAVGGCRQDMHDQPRYEAFEHSNFFADERASRLPVPGTVARGQLDEDAAFFTGKADEGLIERVPVRVDIALMRRGRERYEIFCAPCHDRVGTGKGMIVQRGYKEAPSFHQPRLREAADGYFFQVIRDGFGVMPSYAAQIPPRDRWAIVAYIRALQLSQAARLEDVPTDVGTRLQEESNG